MKSFRFDELWILSEKDGRARHLQWSGNRNLLVGGNHTGKSSALRMLFHAFGCKVKPLGKEWDSGATVAVQFSLEDTPYTMLRRSEIFALFNHDGTLGWATDDAGDLRLHLSKLLDFSLLLTTQNGEARQARPAFFFVPTFIDQDGSWLLNWDTFDNLGEFKNWKKPTVELALGIRPSKYWQVVTDLNVARRRVEDVRKEQQAFADARKRLAEKFPRIPWFTDALTFRRELKELEVRAGSLAKEQSAVRDELVEAAAGRDTLKAQIQLMDEALASHNADMRYLSGRRVGEDIICPTCGTAHEHSFFERLNLEAEADELRQMREMLAQQAKRAEKRVGGQEERLSELQHACEAIEQLLSRGKGDLKLREIVDRAGVGKAYDALEEQSKSVDEKLFELQREIATLEERRGGLDDKKRAALIKRKFNSHYAKFAHELEVPPSLKTRKGEAHNRPRQGGSGGPRAVLAYYFAMSHTAAEFSEGYLPPLVIDSPHVNAQDDINRPRVTEFILKNTVPGQQLIVGLEDEPPKSAVIHPPADKRFDLKEKYGFLHKKEYANVFAFVEPLVGAAIRNVGKSLF
jgi:hypothetical protein